jgi:hypothetical protein
MWYFRVILCVNNLLLVRPHNSCINFISYFTTCFGILCPISGKIFILALCFTDILPYIGQGLQLGQIVRVICQG